MSVLTFVLGFAMAVAGAISIGMGVPYIRMEFGWTEVIAGVTALSAGLVVIAVAAMLAKLDRLIRVLERNAGRADATDKGGRRPADAVAAVAASTPGGDDPALEPGEVHPPAFSEADGAGRPQRRSFFGRFARATPDRHDARPGEPSTAPLAVDVGPVPSVTRARGAPQPRVEPSLSLTGENAGHAAPEPDVRPSPDAEASDGLAPEGPTVMGRYEAGGASYVLFSDGTIEVETETGVHRFGSMAELKQFIDHGDG